MLNKKEIQFIQRNKEMIASILNKRIEEYKNILIEAEPEQREQIINWIKEYKKGLNIIKSIDKNNTQFTGI